MAVQVIAIESYEPSSKPVKGVIYKGVLFGL